MLGDPETAVLDQPLRRRLDKQDNPVVFAVTVEPAVGAGQRHFAKNASVMFLVPKGIIIRLLPNHVARAPILTNQPFIVVIAVNITAGPQDAAVVIDHVRVLVKLGVRHVPALRGQSQEDATGPVAGSRIDAIAVYDR